MSLDADALWQLLPAVHRNRDAESGGALRALVEVVAEQVLLLEEDLAQLYDDQFIETCADWVVPYIGDLVGYRQLHGATAQLSSPRAEVADTIRLRRGKGTAATLEMLARDLTGWDVHVVEMFRRLAATANVNHLRHAQPAFAGLRDPVPLEEGGRPFDSFAHTAEVRSAGSGRGWYNIASLAIFLWRLRAFPVAAAAPFRVDGSRFLFSPHGMGLPLFSAAVPKDPGAPETTPANVAQPFARRVLAADVAAFYGPDKSFFIEGVAAEAVAVCDLSDAGGGAWAHTPAPGRVAVDPVLGRIAFGTAPASPPRVSYHYGLAGTLGGGGYDRSHSFEALSPVVAVPTRQPTLTAGLAAAAPGGTVEIVDSGRYSETLSVTVSGAGARLELRAATLEAPFLALGGDLAISGTDGAEVVLNGLWVSGGSLRVSASPGNALQRLTLRHCTLTPGIARNADGSPARPGVPSLVVETDVAVEIEDCILGGILAVPGASVTISRSIVDAGAQSAVAYAAPDGAAAGAALSIVDSTVVGKVHAAQITLASNVVFAAGLRPGDAWPAPVWAGTRHTGCTRFCYVPPGSRVPRPYRCQPGPGSDLGTVRPVFTSLRFSDPGYGQLSRRTPVELREGAEDGAEMGVFRALAQPQREANLRLRLDEYLRFGLEAALVFVT